MGPDPLLPREKDSRDVSRARKKQVGPQMVRFGQVPHRLPQDTRRFEARSQKTEDRIGERIHSEGYHRKASRATAQAIWLKSIDRHALLELSQILAHIAGHPEPFICAQAGEDNCQVFPLQEDLHRLKPQLLQESDKDSELDQTKATVREILAGLPSQIIWDRAREHAVQL